MESKDVLAGRLDAAHADLNAAKAMLADMCVELDDPALGTVRKLLEQELHDRESELADFESELASTPSQKSWKGLESIRLDRQRTFQECLAMLGGLSIRAEGQDRDLCRIADVLQAEIVARLPTKVSIAGATILDSAISYHRTSQMVRIRFPDFSVWSLPAVAHELGHALFQELDQLLPEEDWKTSPFRAMSEKLIDGRSLPHVRELYADYFACQAVGPGYACCSLLADFDLASAQRVVDSHPSARERAHVILSSLLDVDPAYADIARMLKGTWTAMLSAAGVAPLDDEMVRGLDTCVSEFRAVSRGLKGLPYLGRERVQGILASLSIDQHPPSSIMTGSDVADVVNAAWIARINRWHQRLANKASGQRTLEELSLDLCRQVVNRRSGGPGE
jgi:hypothetical protein